MSQNNEHILTLGPKAARHLANATVTRPQWDEISPRWLLQLLPYVDVDGGIYRVNRIQSREGHPTVALVTTYGGEEQLPGTFVPYEEEPREVDTLVRVLKTLPCN